MGHLPEHNTKPDIEYGILPIESVSDLSQWTFCHWLLQFLDRCHGVWSKPIEVTGILNRKQSIHVNCLFSFQQLPHSPKAKVWKSGHIWQMFREQDKIIGLGGRGIFRKPLTQDSCVGRCCLLLGETLSSLVTSWSKSVLRYESVYRPQQHLFIKCT